MVTLDRCRDKPLNRSPSKASGAKSYPLSPAPLRVNRRAQPLLLYQEEHEV